MKTTRVYDLPTRLFHWIFAALFVGAFLITKLVDDESPTFSYHMLLGLMLALTVVLRIIWGFVGSRYARFSSFALRPSELVRYFADLLLSKSERNLGHNPASSWAALMMMGLALGLALSGYLMTSGGNKEFFEELHEVFANAFLVIVILHIAGVIFHTLRHKDAIGLSMIHGGKMAVEGEVGIEKNHVLAGLVFMFIVGAFALNLNKNYDPTNQTLNLFGTTLQLGESENEGHSKGEGHEEHEGRGKHEEHDDDGDDD